MFKCLTLPVWKVWTQPAAHPVWKVWRMSTEPEPEPVAVTDERCLILDD